MKNTTLTQHTSFALAAVAAVCLAGVTLNAQANETALSVPARTVHYSDLNLNTAAGAASLYQRIQNAAAQVCGDVGSRQMDQSAAAKACVVQAIQSSVRAVNSAKLTAVYRVHVDAAAQPITLASVR